jgi:hypothetical protein
MNKLLRIGNVLALLLISNAYGDTPGQVINKTCSPSQWFSAITKTAAPVCSQPQYTDIGNTPTIYYQTVQDNGTDKTQRGKLNFSSKFNITDSSLNGNSTVDLDSIIAVDISGNAATCTAFATTPSQCSAGQFATGIAANGNANCGTPTDTGITSINGQTATAELLTTSETGTNFTISQSGLATNVFNLPIASSVNTGKLSSTDWSTFNGKQPAGNYITALTTDVVAAGPGSVVATIQPGVVTNSKLAAMATSRFKARIAAGSGDPQDLTGTQATTLLDNFVGDSGSGGTKGLVIAPATGDATKFLKGDATWAVPTDTGITQLTSDVTAGPGSGSQVATIAADAVTNTKLANMAQSTIKGRAAGAGTGDPTDLTATQATAILDNFVGDTGTGGTKGLVVAPAAGDAAAGKFLKADATWAVPPDTGITQLTGDVTAGPGSGSQAATIANDAVTNAKLANMATQTFKGRTTAGTGDPEDLTVTQATAMLNVMTGGGGTGLKGLTPAQVAGDVSKFLKGDATWAAVDLAANVTGVLPMANGGTNKNMTANAGAIAYSDADSLELNTPSTVAGQVLQGNTTSAPTFSTATYPSTGGTSGTILRSNGTNWVNTTATYPTTTTINRILYSSAANTVSEITSGATSALVTNSSSVPSFTSGSTANRLLRTDGTTVSFAQAALTTDVTGVLPVANGGTNNSTAYTAGSVIFSDGSRLTQENPNFFWDNTNKREGLGTTAPAGRLHVNNAGVSNEIGITVTGHASQTANLTTWENSAGTDLASVNASGSVAANPTGSAVDVDFQFTGDADSGLRRNSSNNVSVFAKAIDMQQWDAVNGKITINPAFQGFDTYIQTANDPTGTFYVSGGGDHVDLGLGETPVVAGAPSKLNIQVGGIRSNFGGMTITHIPTASTGSIIPPDIRSDFSFELNTAVAKSLTRSQVEYTYNPTTSLAGGVLTLGTSSNKAMQMMTFAPTQTAGTLTYSAFRALQYQRNIDGAGIVEEMDFNQTGAHRDRYNWAKPALTLGIAGVKDTIVVAFGTNYALPSTSYTLTTSGGYATAIKAPATRYDIHSTCQCPDALKLTTGFTCYIQYHVYLQATGVGVGYYNDQAAMNAALGPLAIASPNDLSCDIQLRRYY